MPQLDPNRSRDIHEDFREVRASPITRIAPYQPLKQTPKVQPAPPVQLTVSVDRLAVIVRGPISRF